MRATIKDVAREAGVSVSTVTYVLQRKGPPKTDVQKRVVEAVARLKYSPSPTARKLVQKSPSKAIAVVCVPNSLLGFHDPHLDEEMNYLNRTISAAGYWMSVYLPGYQDDRLETCLRETEMAGLIWTRQDIPDFVTEILESRNIPFVTVEHHLDIPGNPRCLRQIVAYEQALEPAIHYLNSMGHKRIALMAGRSGRYTASAYHQAMDAAGLSFRMVLGGDYTEQGASEAYQTMHRETPLEERPTAIITLNDPMAVGVIEAAASMGVSVPEQLSVLGFDDSVAATYARTKLSSMAYPFQQIADDAVRYLDECIRGESVFIPAPKYYSFSLVVRESTGPAPAEPV